MPVEPKEGRQSNIGVVGKRDTKQIPKNGWLLFVVSSFFSYSCKYGISFVQGSYMILVETYPVFLPHGHQSPGFFSNLALAQTPGSDCDGIH